MSQGALFPRAIERIDNLVEGPAVQVRCRSDAVFALSPDGRRWVFKKGIAPAGVLAEAIAWLVCKHLKIDIPHAAAVRVTRDAGPVWLWASEYTMLHHWSSEWLPLVGDASAFAALLAVDAWLGNADRHDKNLVVRQFEETERVEFLALDFDAAWVGDEEERRARQTSHPCPDRIAPPTELWMHAVPAWVARVQQIEQSLLRQFVAEACELAESPAAKPILDWLVVRQKSLDTLAAAMAAELVEVPS